MLRITCALSFVVAAGCTSTGSAPSAGRQSPIEFQLAAASVMGRNVDGGIPPDSGSVSARVQLESSPGLTSGLGSHEVLRSNPRSGYYVAFTGQVPVTQYFKIVGRADCDDWVYLQLMNPSMISGNPNHYISGEYIGDKAALKCAASFHNKFRRGTDARLQGTDGVVFDAESAVFTETDGFAIGYKKLHMVGWTVKFMEPTEDAIRDRLARKAASPIDIVQLKTVAYWIKKHKARQFAGDLRRLLPVGDGQNALTGWSGADLDLFRALVAVDNEGLHAEVYWSVLDAGIAETLLPGSRTAVAVPLVGNIPYLAANALACLNRPGTVDHLRRVLLGSTVIQHKIASAVALVNMGDTTFVEAQLRAGTLGNISNNVARLLSGRDSAPFACPAEGNAGE